MPQRLIEIVLNAKRETVSFEVFNAGGEKNNATKEMIVNKISSLIGKVNVRYGENGSDPRNYRVDFSKVKSFTKELSFSELLETYPKLLKGEFFGRAIVNPNK